jgi:hypothetical protein
MELHNHGIRAKDQKTRVVIFDEYSYQRGVLAADDASIPKLKQRISCPMISR